MDRFGFSWLGVAFVVALFLPNIIWAKNRPRNADPQWGQSSVALGLERLGQILVCAAAITCARLQLGTWRSASWMIVAAAALMVAYEVWWARYFKEHRNDPGFYSGFIYIPVSGAFLSLGSFLLLGIFAQDLLLIASVGVLAIGRAGVDQAHKKEQRMREEEQRDLQRRP